MIINYVVSSELNQLLYRSVRNHPYILLLGRLPIKQLKKKMNCNRHRYHKMFCQTQCFRKKFALFESRYIEDGHSELRMS